MKPCLAILAFFCIGSIAACSPSMQPSIKPEGQEKSAKTRVLETGSTILQTDSPLDPLNIYLVGFHVAKEDPSHQMEAHHFCNQVNEDFAQCVIFDGNTQGANLIGVEYIISETLFESLPDNEKKYWHPHNFEILSGQLIAPNLPNIAEMELMKGKMNSYGKTWHVWNSAPFGKDGDKLPFGSPVLEWSFNRDEEEIPGLIEQRDQRLGVNTQEKRQERNDLTQLARPQSGVDALKEKFIKSTMPLSGVVDSEVINKNLSK
ncbi:OBAP family protein [Nitrosomonas sp. Nm166]|uniref:OBAP family protein n=1 Tax=Nitrosomonas sp. Nm166 TaxID=1881054 RepID=UPI0008E0E2A6|nr:OBAP family protein [Nitrosomonas sp. Nm166]SFE61206.1 Protein of unknown function [Nitrosomonas sp. Nm166]